MQKDLRVIGIDPGSNVTGWGIIEQKSGVLSLVDCGAIRAKAPNSGQSFGQRLAYIFWELSAIINMLKPEEAAIETMFSAVNVASAIKLGQARGVALAACANKSIEIFDYAPTEVKKAIVGVGRAEKSQVAYMVANYLGIKPNNITWALDTSDALAIAICHLNMRQSAQLLGQGKGKSKLDLAIAEATKDSKKIKVPPAPKISKLELLIKQAKSKG